MYCSKCGKEIGEKATFCSNCGNRIDNAYKANKTVVNMQCFDIKKALISLKEYFTHFYTEYNSKSFKFAMLMFLAIGIGKPIYSIVLSTLGEIITGLFSGASTVCEFLIYILLFGLFSIPILKRKPKTTIKKSYLLVVLWVVFTVLNVFVFFAGLSLPQYILLPQYASYTIKFFAAIFSVCLIYKNKPKYPVILFFSALSLALSNSSWDFIGWDITRYNIWKTSASFFGVLYELKYIILVVVLFLLVYLFPRKISKWLVYIPVTFAIVHTFIELINNFSFVGIFSYIINISLVLLFLLLALSCSKSGNHDFVVCEKNATKKGSIKIGILSAAILAIIIPCYLLVSAMICSKQINSGVEKWRVKTLGATFSNSDQWDEMYDDIFKYRCTKFVSQFIDDYSFYVTLNDNFFRMKNIWCCYLSYKRGVVNESTIEDYSHISIDDTWKSNNLLYKYYEMYAEMQPDIKNVSATAYFDLDRGRIEVTINNENTMPISSCTVSCEFNIMFIKSGWYSDPYYGRGTKTITIKNIGGKANKTETVLFNPDDYYDSYGSYISAFLQRKNVSVTSIES